MLTPYDQTELRVIYAVLVLLTACLVLAASSWLDLRLHHPRDRHYHRLARRARITTVCTFALTGAWALAWALS